MGSGSPYAVNADRNISSLRKIQVDCCCDDYLRERRKAPPAKPAGNACEVAVSIVRADLRVRAD
jgi:hypothetical protein